MSEVLDYPDIGYDVQLYSCTAVQLYGHTRMAEDTTMAEWAPLQPSAVSQLCACAGETREAGHQRR